MSLATALIVVYALSALFVGFVAFVQQGRTTYPTKWAAMQDLLLDITLTFVPVLNTTIAVFMLYWAAIGARRAAKRADFAETAL